MTTPAHLKQVRGFFITMNNDTNFFTDDDRETFFARITERTHAHTYGVSVVDATDLALVRVESPKRVTRFIHDHITRAHGAMQQVREYCASQPRKVRT